MTNRLLYSMIDSNFPVSARIQHKIIAEFGSEIGCKVGFYGAEDPEFCVESPYLIAKLPTLLSTYDGIVFFSVFQLAPEDTLNTVRFILDKELEVCFACQRIRISSYLDFEREKISLLAASTAVKARKLAGTLARFRPPLDSDSYQSI